LLLYGFFLLSPCSASLYCRSASLNCFNFSCACNNSFSSLSNFKYLSFLGFVSLGCFASLGFVSLGCFSLGCFSALGFASLGFASLGAFSSLGVFSVGCSAFLGLPRVFLTYSASIGLLSIFLLLGCCSIVYIIGFWFI